MRHTTDYVTNTTSNLVRVRGRLVYCKSHVVSFALTLFSSISCDLFYSELGPGTKSKIYNRKKIEKAQKLKRSNRRNRGNYAYL